MRKIIGLSALSPLVLALPYVVSAQAMGLMGTLITVNRFLNGLIGIIITIAIIVFFWGLVQYLTTVGGENKHQGLMTMFYGLIAIFVMVSIWGIIHLLQATFGIQGANQAIVPAIVPSGATAY